MYHKAHTTKETAFAAARNPFSRPGHPPLVLVREKDHIPKNTGL